jgi:hypothetical protein
MENAELLKLLGWSDDLIAQMGQVGKSLPVIRQPVLSQPKFEYATSTTTSVTYSTETDKTYTCGSVTI